MTFSEIKSLWALGENREEKTRLQKKKKKATLRNLRIENRLFICSARISEFRERVNGKCIFIIFDEGSIPEICKSFSIKKIHILQLVLVAAGVKAIIQFSISWQGPALGQQSDRSLYQFLW